MEALRAYVTKAFCGEKGANFLDDKDIQGSRITKYALDQR